MHVPEPPTITADELKTCHDSGNYCPILFKWYQFVAEFCMTFANIGLESKSLKKVDPLNYAVLVGLLNRCARLMFSNIVLSHQGLHGETTSILDRCIFESSVVITWLCDQDSEQKFKQYLADGLKTELRLKKKIHKNIAQRKDKQFPIETRMLESIERYIKSSQLTEDQISSINKIPNIANMLQNEKNELLYIVAQKIGSHHVHGTWPSLLLHYLEQSEDGSFFPSGHNSETHQNQYIVTMLYVLNAMQAFTRFVFSRQDFREVFLSQIKSIMTEIDKINMAIT